MWLEMYIFSYKCIFITSVKGKNFCMNMSLLVTWEYMRKYGARHRNSRYGYFIKNSFPLVCRGPMYIELKKLKYFVSKYRLIRSRPLQMFISSKWTHSVIAVSTAHPNPVEIGLTCSVFLQCKFFCGMCCYWHF